MEGLNSAIWPCSGFGIVLHHQHSSCSSLILLLVSVIISYDGNIYVRVPHNGLEHLLCLG